MSRAGCSAGMFSASKQCHSSSTSGPSTMAKPMRVKISSMRSRTMVSGWRWPSERDAAGQRDVDARPRRTRALRARRDGFGRFGHALLDRLLEARWRARRVRAVRRAGAVATILHQAVTTLSLRPRYRSRTACASRALVAARSSLVERMRAARSRPGFMSGTGRSVEVTSKGHDSVVGLRRLTGGCRPRSGASRRFRRRSWPAARASQTPRGSRWRAPTGSCDRA